MEKLDSFIAIRRRNFQELKLFFLNYQDLFILPEQNSRAETAWLAFPLTIKEGAPFRRKDLQIYLERRGIQTRTNFAGNLLRHPGFKGIPCRTRAEGYPAADNIFRNSFLIGCHHGLTSEDLAYLKQSFTDFFKSI